MHPYKPLYQIQETFYVYLVTLNGLKLVYSAKTRNYDAILVFRQELGIGVIVHNFRCQIRILHKILP